MEVGDGSEGEGMRGVRCEGTDLGEGCKERERRRNISHVPPSVGP